MENCIFCKIAAKEIPANIVYEDEDILAFRDINPIAPVHILIIPKKHIPDLTNASDADIDVLGKIQVLSARIAKEEGIAEKGYRLINNCREHGGQVVFHVHYHLVGGRQLTSMG